MTNLNDFKPAYVYPNESSPQGNALVIRAQVIGILQREVSQDVADTFRERAEETRYKDLKALVREYCTLVVPHYVPEDEDE